MLRNNKKFLSLFMTLLLSLSLFTGCGKAKPIVSTDTNLNSNALPIVKKPITLKYFMASDAKWTATMKTLNEAACYKEMEKKTGIHIEFICPPVGTELDQFNLMMASGDLPDMIDWSWLTVPGGPLKSVTDESIMSLNTSIDKYAPNLKAIIAGSPQLNKEVRADDGTIYNFPYLYMERVAKGSANTNPAFQTFGWQIRQDWLTKLGLKLPVTIDDWDAVLTAFRDKDPNGNGKKDEIPLVAGKMGELTPWVRAWGIDYGFYNDANTIKFGPSEAVYKDALTTLAKWYKDGIIDKDFATTDGKQKDAKVSGNIAGAWVGSTSGGLGRYVQLMKAANPAVKLTGTVPPYVTGGKEYKYDNNATWQYLGMGTAINPKSKYVVEAVKWNDYKYSKEGHMLFNYGIEGQSYKMVNGEPTLMDNIIKNPKLSVDQALNQFAMSAGMTSMVMDPAVWQQRMYMPEQQEAIGRWSKGDTTRILPQITPTADEASKMSKIISQVNSYKDEMFVKFVMGQEPISNFNKYLDQLNKLGIKDAISIEQAGLDRFNKRK